MRIFFLNAYFDPTCYAGSRIHIEQLAKHVKEMGHELWVQPSSPLVYGQKLSNNRFERLAQVRNMDVFYYRIEGQPVLLPYYMREPWRRLGYDKKVVWEINAASDYIALKSDSSAAAVRDNLDLKLARQAKQVDLAICNTDGLVNYAYDLGIRNAAAISLATDPEMFTGDVTPTQYVTRKRDRLNVVWSGNSDVPWHDFETIRKAAWRLRDNDSIRFYFLGVPPRQVRFTDNVILLGLIPYEEMPNYLEAMDVGLAIYRNDSWSRYGVFSSPLKLFDYFASKLIVIASPIEQVLKCVDNEKSGFIVPFSDDKALADQLRFIANHKAELKSIGERARESAVDFYNWQRVARETIGAIERLF